MDLNDAGTRQALERFLASAAGARQLAITAATPLPGGTVNENWALTVAIADGPERATTALVLRTDRAVGVAGSLSRRQEFAVMQAAHAAGVLVPEPLWLGERSGPLGRDFFIMRFVAGTAAAAAIVHDPLLGGPHERLAEHLGEQLARLQSVTPASGKLDFLPVPAAGAASALIAELRTLLDGFTSAHPVIEWGLRWLELHAPAPCDLVLAHGDFRTGNYLVDEHDLTAILDWELASWSDPLADIGWFCMRFWRLDEEAKTAGGIAGREALLRGYTRITGRVVDPDALCYWEIMANVRWAVISIQQAQRHLSGQVDSLELCLTGRRTAELEFEFLHLLDEAKAGGRTACATDLT